MSGSTTSIEVRRVDERPHAARAGSDTSLAVAFLVAAVVLYTIVGWALYLAVRAVL
jgi:hypothetical protein